MIEHSFYGFTDATCHRDMTIIGMIPKILIMFGNTNNDCFPPIRRKVTRNPNFILKVITMEI